MVLPRFDRRLVLSQLAGALAAGGCSRSRAASGNWPGAWVAGLWRDLPRLRVPAGTTSLATTGYTRAGQGAGLYVSDAKADAALAAAHPRLCQPSADGRFWRLAATEDAITVDQAGAQADGHSNDRDAIQAAVNYAAALGVRHVDFPGSTYSIWMAPRTTAFWHWASDGHGIAVPADLAAGTLHLRGVNGQAHLRFFSADGGPFAAAMQTIAADGNPWRGSGIFQDIPARDPGLGHRPNLVVEKLWLDGGTTANGRLDWTNPKADAREGWDVSNKGIAVRPDRPNGDLHLIDTRITGFRGELVYAGNHPDGALVLEGLIELAETNAQALNPSGGRVICPGFVKAWNVNVFFEGWGGFGNLRGEFRNVLASGSCLTGGVIDTTGSGNGFKPQRPLSRRWADDAQGFTLDILVSSAGKTIFLGSYLRGRVVAVDTVVAVGANEVSGPFKLGVTGTDLEIVSVCDKANLPVALALAGASAPGTRQFHDCRYRLTLQRTDAAVASGFCQADAVQVLVSSYGPGIVIEHSTGVSRRGSGLAGKVMPLPDYYPCFRHNSFAAWADWAISQQDVGQMPAIIPRGDRMGLMTAANAPGIAPITLPTTGINDGHELTLVNIMPPARGWSFALDAQGAGARLARRRVVVAGGSLPLRFSAAQGAWVEASAQP